MGPSEASGYKKFSIDGRYFVYDQSRHAILRITKNVYEILDDYFRLTPDLLRQRSLQRMSEQDFGAALRCLDQAVRVEGRFQPAPPQDYTRILDREFLKQGLATGMRNLCLTITEQCNLRCTYCINSGKYLGEFAHNSRHMTWDVARRSIDYFMPRTDPNAGAAISFFGGEPLLGWDLIQKCVRHVRGNYALADNLAMTVVTNGTLLTPRILDFLITHGLFLQVSLDGPQPIHDSARVSANGAGSYEKVMAALQEIRRRDPAYFSKNVNIACCIDRNKDVIDLFHFFNSEDFEPVRVSFNPIKEDDAGSYVEDAETERHYNGQLGQLVELYLSSLRSGQRFNYPLFRELLFRVFKLGWDPITPDMAKGRFPNPVCLPGISKIYVASDGTFYPCERVRLRGTEIGDYRTGVDLEKVVTLVQLFADFCAENCGSCWAQGLCCHCFVHFLEKGQVCRNKKLDYCRHEKEMLVEGFRKFIRIWENETASARKNPESLHARTEKVRYSVLNSAGRTN